MGVQIVKRVLFGGFALVFFWLAAQQFRTSGLTAKGAFAGVSGLALGIACLTAKG